MSIGGYNVKITGTSRGCKANIIESRDRASPSGQERVDRDEQSPCDEWVRVGNGMRIVLVVVNPVRIYFKRINIAERT